MNSYSITVIILSICYITEDGSNERRKQKMGKTVEIRWHGRGGQGAKTASLLLAEAAFNTGKYIQGFPEYGPERMGAPITAYNRIADSKIRIHSNIYEPDYVVVVDETLIKDVDVAAGLKKDGAILVNTQKEPAEIKKQLKGFEGRVYTVDALNISLETLGRYFPNTPMLGAVVKVSGIMAEEEFISSMEESFKHKFASKPEVIEGNMKAVKKALQEVKGI
jgi:pyruvate ferredoxin oxidoreductase gamma subunit